MFAPLTTIHPPHDDKLEESAPSLMYKLNELREPPTPTLACRLRFAVAEEAMLKLLGVLWAGEGSSSSGRYTSRIKCEGESVSGIVHCIKLGVLLV